MSEIPDGVFVVVSILAFAGLAVGGRVLEDWIRKWLRRRRGV